MFLDLPDPRILYRALETRDPGYDGHAFVGVVTTGIFCRLTCPARNPKPENCRFYATTSECLEAGFRACKRCSPLAPAALGDPVVVALLAALEDRPDARWTETDVQALGVDPSTARRSFKRHFGVTFLELARRRRVRDGFTALAEGARVIDAQIDAGFESPSAFRTAFAKLLGCPPGDLKHSGALLADWIPTPLGDMIAVCSKRHLHLLEFLDRKALPRELSRLRADTNGDLGAGVSQPSEQVREELDHYFSGECSTFQTPLSLQGSAFARSVWNELRRIPAGTTRSYAEVAKSIGRPTATRAVARANGANQIALLVPCHRVIGADGALTGYGGGLWRKQRLLEIERAFQRP